jgi:predicted nucleic acid-binding protein
MTYFDTNVLVYFTIDQGKGHFDLAQQYVFEAVKSETFLISPLVLSEYIFVLSKIKILDQHHKKVDFFATSTMPSTSNSPSTIASGL